MERREKMALLSFISILHLSAQFTTSSDVFKKQEEEGHVYALNHLSNQTFF